jgi:hypothetical protein
MKKTEITNAVVKELVAEMFADGKNPMERFGICWEDAESIDIENHEVNIEFDYESRLYA